MAFGGENAVAVAVVLVCTDLNVVRNIEDGFALFEFADQVFGRSEKAVVLCPKTIFEKGLEEYAHEDKKAKNHGLGSEVARSETEVRVAR